MPRGADGAIAGGQCLTGAVALYDVGGAIRAMLIGLQDQVRARQAKPERDGPD